MDQARASLFANRSQERARNRFGPYLRHHEQADLRARQRLCALVARDKVAHKDLLDTLKSEAEKARGSSSSKARNKYPTGSPQTSAAQCSMMQHTTNYTTEEEEEDVDEPSGTYEEEAMSIRRSSMAACSRNSRASRYSMRISRLTTASEKGEERWVMSSLIIVGYITFLGDCARGLLFPVLWPLAASLHGTLIDLGYLVAVFSVGRLVIATRLGIISDHHGHRVALLLSAVILAVGAVMWANCSRIGALPVLYLSQFLLGLGTGSLGVTRDYVVELTPPQSRTYMLARLSALQYAGFSATPVVGALFIVAGAAISSFWKFSLTAYLVLFMSLCSIQLLLYPFQDVPRDDEVVDVESSPSPQQQQQDKQLQLQLQQARVNAQVVASFSVKPEEGGIVMNPLSKEAERTTVTTDVTYATPSPLPPSSAPPSTLHVVEITRCGYLLMLLNFSTRGVVAVYETQGSQLLLDHYGFSYIQLGALISVCGTIGTVQLIFFKEFWTRRFTDLQLMLMGLCITGLAQLLVIRWTPSDADSMWRFIISAFLVYAFGYPLANSAVLGSFSMLQKTGRQAKAQGRFALFGSAARILMPILSGYFEQEVAMTSSFALNLILVGVSLGGIIFFSNQLVFCTVGGGDEKKSPTEIDAPLSLLAHGGIGLSLLITACGIGSIFEWGQHL